MTRGAREVGWNAGACNPDSGRVSPANECQLAPVTVPQCERLARGRGRRQPHGGSCSPTCACVRHYVVAQLLWAAASRPGSRCRGTHDGGDASVHVLLKAGSVAADGRSNRCSSGSPGSARHGYTHVVVRGNSRECTESHRLLSPWRASNLSSSSIRRRFALWRRRNPEI